MIRPNRQAKQVFHQENKKPSPKLLLPTDAKERKGLPVATGFLDYFSAAIIEVCKISKAGNDQHNPGQPLHWSRGKSTDHADTMIRHFMERGTIDTDGMRHSAKMVWRACALLQQELEDAGAPVSRGSKYPASKPLPEFPTFDALVDYFKIGGTE